MPPLSRDPRGKCWLARTAICEHSNDHCIVDIRLFSVAERVPSAPCSTPFKFGVTVQSVALFTSARGRSAELPIIIPLISRQSPFRKEEHTATRASAMPTPNRILGARGISKPSSSLPVMMSSINGQKFYSSGLPLSIWALAPICDCRA